jgi:hypothetical protein
MPGNLDGEVGAGPKTEQPQPLTGLQVCLAQRAVANDSGAEQGRGLLGGERLGQGQQVAGVCQYVLGKAAVYMKAGKLGVGAQVLLPAEAVGAGAVCAVQPGNTYPLPQLRIANSTFTYGVLT